MSVTPPIAPQGRVRSRVRVALIAVAILLAMVAVIFVGFNLSHYQTKKEQDRGEVRPDQRPRSPNDLTREPVQ